MNNTNPALQPLQGTLYLCDDTDRQIIPANPDNGFELAELYDLLDCEMIEVVNLPDSRIMIIDEEGKLKGRLRNGMASLIAATHLLPHDFIAGPALVCPSHLLK